MQNNHCHRVTTQLQLIIIILLLLLLLLTADGSKQFLHFKHCGFSDSRLFPSSSCGVKSILPSGPESLKPVLRNVNAKHDRDIDDCLRVTERLKQKSTLYWIGLLPIYHMNDIGHTSRPISCNHLKQVFSIKSLAFENNFQFVEHRGSVPNVSRSNQDNRYASLNVTHAANIGLRERHWPGASTHYSHCASPRLALAFQFPPRLIYSNLEI